MALDRPDDWVILFDKTLTVELGELLLLDWIFCTASNLVPGAGVDCLIEDYGDLRMRIWQSITNIKGSVAEIIMAPGEMKELMALVPTTFRWGTGPDVGYTLKLKLAREILPREKE